MTTEQIASKPDHGTILTKDGRAEFLFQLYLDDITRLLNDNLLGLQVVFPVYAFADLPKVDGDLEDPPVPLFPTVSGAIFVTGTDKNSGNQVPAYSDITTNVWRYFSDNGVVTVA